MPACLLVTLEVSILEKSPEDRPAPLGLRPDTHNHVTLKNLLSLSSHFSNKFPQTDNSRNRKTKKSLRY